MYLDSLLRNLSLLARSMQSSRKGKRRLRTFHEWKAELLELIPKSDAVPKQKKLLIIRLDDIGDYLLFRNSLEHYRKSSRFREYHITLLGNVVWKGFFEIFDSSSVDEVIWINKKQYRGESEYRKTVLQQLWNKSFEVVICPSRTRPMLLDDLCTIASCAKTTIAASNTLDSIEHERISDAGYTALFPRNDLIHEFEYNQLFAKWCCDSCLPISTRPVIVPDKMNSSSDKPYLLFCLGSSVKSRRWPVDKWISLMKKYREKCSLPLVLETGSIDSELASYIQNRIKLDMVTGKTTLPEVASWISSAAVVFAQDSMAAHLSVSCGTPTLIIANGMHYHRFSSYADAGIANVKTVVPTVFIEWRKKNPNISILKYTAVSGDIATISVDAVFECAEELTHKDYCKHQK